MAQRSVQRPKGERHPVSSNVLRRPFNEMTSTTEPSVKQPALAPEKEFDLEGVPLGSWFTKFLGDRSAGGKALTSVNEQALENPVELEGGFDFMRRPDANWASDKGVVTGIKKQIDKLQETGDPVYGASVGMGGQAIDYSSMPINTALELIKHNPLSKEAKESIDTAMREDWGKPNKAGKIEYPGLPDFPGIDDLTPEWLKENGMGRKKLTKLMDTNKAAKLGFPDMGSVRKAVTDPKQLHDELGTTGRGIVRASPEEVQHITDPEFPHADYASQLKVGSYEGGTEGFPLGEFWSDWMKTRPQGETMDRTMYSFGRQPVAQKVTQEWKDRLLKLREYKLSAQGKKLGLAGAISAGIITAPEAKELFGHEG